MNIEYKTIAELAQILRDDPDAQIVTTDAYRRGDIVCEWSKILNAKFRSSRWFGPAHVRIFDRIALDGEVIPGAYYDEALKPL